MDRDSSLIEIYLLAIGNYNLIYAFYCWTVKLYHWTYIMKSPHVHQLIDPLSEFGRVCLGGSLKYSEKMMEQGKINLE